ncbi:MAG: recombinase family protein [Candidatus Helarchaeota archaeon]
MKHDEKRSRKMHGEGIKGNAVKVAAIYARVSARKQLDDLQRQLSFLERCVQDAVFKKVMLYKDVASGVNDSRNGMKKLLRDAFHRRFQALFITHHDRLARFGTNLIRTPQNWDAVFCPKCKKKTFQDRKRIIHQKTRPYNTG